MNNPSISVNKNRLKIVKRVEKTEKFFGNKTEIFYVNEKRKVYIENVE